MPGGGTSESEWDAYVLVPSGNSPIQGHADLYRRMVLAEFSSSQRIAFSLHDPGDFDRTGNLFASAARPRTSFVVSDDVAGIAFGASYTDFCTRRRANP